MVSMPLTAPTSADFAPDSLLAQLLLGRLERAVVRLGDRQVLSVPAWHNLARLAAAESYQDCLALGLQDEASVIAAGVDLGLNV